MQAAQQWNSSTAYTKMNSSTAMNQQHIKPTAAAVRLLVATQH
jgi:hypothetical protein